MKRNSKLLLLAILLYSIGQVIVSIYALTKADRFTNPIVPTIMMSSYFASLAVFSLIFSKYSDKLKKRNIFNIFGAFLTAIFYLLYIFTSDPLIFILIHTLLGIAYSLISSTSQALFTEMEPEIEHGKLMSYYNIVGSVGWSIGALFGGFIDQFYSDFVFIFFSIITFCASFVIIFVHDIPFNIEPIRINNIQSNYKNNNLSKNFKHIIFILTLIVLFRHLTSQGSVVALLPIWLTRLGASESESGFILSINTIAQAILMIPIGRLTDKIGRKKVLGIGLIFTGLAAFFYSFATNPWHIVAVQILIAIGWTSLIISSTAIITDITTRENRSTGMGWLNAGLSIGGASGPLISGLLLYFLSNLLKSDISIRGFFDPLISFLTNGNLVFILTFQIISLFSIGAIIMWLKLKENKKIHEYWW